MVLRIIAAPILARRNRHGNNNKAMCLVRQCKMSGAPEPGLRPALLLRPAWRIMVAAILFVALVGRGLAFAATFTATLDRDTVAVGETATLTLTFEGGDPESLSSFDIPNIQVESRGTSRNFSIINGQASSSVTQTLLLSPSQPGDYTIPALQARIAGQTLTSTPLKLKVVKPGSGATDGGSGE